MRRLRTIGALLALLATLSASLTAAPCAPAEPSDGGSDEAAGHVGHARGATSHEGMDHHGGDSDTHPFDEAGLGCGALMTCGAGLRGMAAAAVQAAVPSRLDGAPPAAVADPSSADRTQDPPPPRLDA